MASTTRQNILLCVSGLTPQIVTETLYALAIDAPEQRRFIPDEIHLITTAEGAERARLALLDKDQGQFWALCRDYDLDGTSIKLDSDTIHTINGRDDRPLPDIRHVDDNEIAADAITSIVRDLTAREHSRLHASIAGGRKTMGFYLGYALSLFGRRDDELSHVLVSQPFENLPTFYYPPNPARVLYTPSGRPVHTADAHITLARIPFVQMRFGLPSALLAGQLGFSDTVHRAQKALGPPHVVIDPNTCQVICNGEAVKMKPVALAFYAWMARRAKANLPGVVRSRLTEAETEAFLREYRMLHGEMDMSADRTIESLENGMSTDHFDRYKTAAHNALQRALGPFATPYQIVKEGKRPFYSFRLDLPASCIELRDRR